MEPISTAFATIVGLVAAYKSEKTSQSDDEYKEFVQWLGEHRHQQIIDLLNLSATTSISI